MTDNFTVTDFTLAGTAFSAVNSGSKETTSVDGSDFSADSAVTLKNQWGGDTNNSIVIEFLDDYDNPGGVGGAVDLKVSLDGGKTFESFNNVTDADNDGIITLNDTPTLGREVTSRWTSISLRIMDLKMVTRSCFASALKASIEYRIGDTGERKEILFETEDTLSEIARKINEESDLGIRGDILNDGSPTDPFRLILTSLTEGRAGEINILNNGTDIAMNGLSFEDAHNDSLTFTGAVNVTGTLNSGLGE